MQLENKFVFIGKSFVLIFIVINSISFFPIDIFNVFYFTNIFNILLDTATLLLLGLAIPKFLYIKKIENLNKIKHKNPKELSDIDIQIDTLKLKEFFNNKLINFCLWFFIVVSISQPITLLFVLNKNDLFVTKSIAALDSALDITKKEILNMPKNILPNELNEDVIKQINEDKKEKILNLENNYDKSIDNLIKKNNVQKFNQIKFIFRNILMSLIWAFAFLKLSKIHSE